MMVLLFVLRNDLFSVLLKETGALDNPITGNMAMDLGKIVLG